MSEDSSIAPGLSAESEKISGYVKRKISERKTSKERPLVARARKEHWPTCLAKVIKKAISISELITEEDQAASLRVLREAKKATHRIFDPATKQLIEVPDHKTRLAAITLELAYTEGRPVERQVQMSGKFEDLQALMERMEHSPAFQRSLQKTMEGKEIPLVLPNAAMEEEVQAT